MREEFSELERGGEMKKTLCRTDGMGGKQENEMKNVLEWQVIKNLEWDAFLEIQAQHSEMWEQCLGLEKYLSDCRPCRWETASHRICIIR